MTLKEIKDEIRKATKEKLEGVLCKLQKERDVLKKKKRKHLKVIEDIEVDMIAKHLYMTQIKQVLRERNDNEKDV